MKKLMLIVLMLAGAVFAADKPVGKYVIVLQSGNETNEGAARAVHALLYARELAEAGYSVVLIFDGAGTGWAAALSKPEHPMHKHYLKIKELGVVEEICDYCSEAFDVKENLSESQRTLLTGDYEGHPSLAKWAQKGYQIIVL
jgi:hypothetical protein